MKVLKKIFVIVFLMFLGLIVQVQSQISPGNYQRIDGNPLRIDAYDDGTLAVYRYENGDYQEQYYDGNSWGSVLYLNGTGEGSLGFNSWYFIDWYDSALPQFVPVSNTMPDPWTIITIFDAGDSGVRIKQTISYTNGNAYYRKVWEITNTGTKAGTGGSTYTDCRFLHGGDTYFAGDDDSEGHWDPNLGMVYLTNPDPGITGIMGFYGALTTPADHYYEDYYGDVGEALIAGQLPDTVLGDYEDAGYGLQWNRSTLAPGETWTIISFEKWTEAGFVQVFAPAEQAGNPEDIINYQFVVANYQNITDTFNLTLNSSNGWNVSLPGGNTVNIPAGESATVNATVTIPADAQPGTTDILTLTATSQSDPDVNNQDSVTTTVLGEIAEELVRIYGGGGGCFIATAAYGSYQEKHVQILRQFRDRYLLTSTAGRAFVRFYYRHSPAVAAIIADSAFLRSVTRIALLPVYGLAFMMLKCKAVFLALSLGFIFFLGWFFRKKYSFRKK